MEERIWHNSYAPGVKKTLDYEKLTLSKALTRSAKNFPDHTALNYMGKKITFKELDALVNSFAFGKAGKIFWFQGRKQK
jgi:long-chain acyl-CoA synthetase